MNTLEFLEYVATPGEKHLGIATIRCGGFILRFKVVPLKENGAFFIAGGTFKMKDPYTQEDKYVNTFEIDSRMEHERILNFVKSHVKAQMTKTGVQTAESSTKPPLPKLSDPNLPF